MQHRRLSGFTLIELSIVLVIIALVTGMGLLGTLGALESARRTATQNKMDAIEKAFMEFRVENNRLPCPSDGATPDLASFGLEGEKTGRCRDGHGNEAIFGWNTGLNGETAIMEGTVPVRTLGLPDDFMYDGWGRRFSYTVMPSYTSNRAFISMHPRETCSGLTVLASDSTTNIRTANAVYTLVSFGPNGHGGYLSSGVGVRMNAGSTDTAELYNCRCDSSATNVASLDYTVQQEATSAFDDIVRYKERWQLQTPDDDYNFNAYTFVQMLIGYTYSGGTLGAAKIYSRDCDAYDLNAVDGSATSANNNISFVGLTQDNTTLMVYSSGANCAFFSITNSSTGPTLGALTAPTSCPTWNANNGVALSNNGYLGITNSSSPYLKLWRLSGAGTSGVANALGVKFSTNPSSQPNKIAISRNAEHIVLSRTSATAYTTVYRRNSDNSLTVLSSQPSGMPAGATVVAFSKDVQFLAAGDGGKTLKLWQYTSPTSFTALSDITIASFGGISSVAFSPDGQYLAIANSDTGKSTIDDVIKIYKIDGTTFTEATTVSTGYDDYSGYTTTAAISAMAFMPDSTLIALEGSTANTTKKVIMLKREGTLTFSYHVGIDTATSAVPASLAVMH